MAGMYAEIVQTSSYWLSSRFKPVLGTIVAVAFVLTIAFVAHAVLDLIGYGINRWVVVDAKAMGAVIAISAVASGVIFAAGLILLAGITGRRHGWASFSSLLVIVLIIISFMLLEPRML